MGCRTGSWSTLPSQQPRHGRFGKAGGVGKAVLWAVVSEGHAALCCCPGGGHIKISGGFADFSLF